MTETVSCENISETAEATHILLCVASSFSYWSLAAPAVILFSVFVAWKSLRSAREIARKKATLDLIEKAETTEFYQTSRKVFSTHRVAGTFDRLHDPKNDTDKKDRSEIQNFLNHHELIAIGIQQQILDLEMYKSYMAGPFVRDWNAASGYIQSERWRLAKEGDEVHFTDDSGKKWHYHHQVYENFQSVAAMISRDANQLDRMAGGIPENPEGLGNEPLPSPERYLSDVDNSRWFNRQNSKKWL